MALLTPKTSFESFCDKKNKTKSFFSFSFRFLENVKTNATDNSFSLSRLKREIVKCSSGRFSDGRRKSISHRTFFEYFHWGKIIQIILSFEYPKWIRNISQCFGKLAFRQNGYKALGTQCASARNLKST